MNLNLGSKCKLNMSGEFQAILHSGNQVCIDAGELEN